MAARIFHLIFAIAFIQAVAASASAGWPHPITIDGQFDDWDLIPAIYESNTGGSGLAIQRMKIAHDEQFVFFKITLNQEIILNDSNSLRLYLDTDNNLTSGLFINGIGADLEWRFGERRGFYHGQSPSIEIKQAAVTLRAAPSISSDRYEFAISRNTVIAGNSLFVGDTIRFVMHAVGAGPIFPVPGDVIVYTFDNNEPVPTEPIAHAREHLDDVRIASFNVWNDGLFDPARAPAFMRLLKATQPDIIHFQEIYNHSAAQTIAFVSAALPGHTWYGAKVNDCVTVSRFPILWWFGVETNLGVHLDTTSALGKESLMFNAHLPCCFNNAGRQWQIDAIMATVRSAVTGIYPLDHGSPIMISGDLNLVGFSQQLKTLLEGDIVNQSTFGPPFNPDWDGSHLTSVMPRQSEKRMGYTWRNDNSTFQPGHLDYHIYADSALDVGRSFTLYTPKMSAQTLAQHGLLPGDSLASDHLLFIVDVRTATQSPKAPGDLNGDGVVDVFDLLILLAAWGECEVEACPADLDGNGTVDVFDLLILLANWG